WSPSTTSTATSARVSSNNSSPTPSTSRRCTWISANHKNSFGLPPHLRHPRQDNPAIAIHPLRMPLQRCRQNRRQPRALLARNVPRRRPVPISRRRFRSINARPPLHLIHIKLENAFLPQHQLRHRHQRSLRAFPDEGSPG